MYNRIDNSRNDKNNSRFAELNEVYVWNTSAKIDLTQVKQPAFKYQENGEVKVAPAGKVYVYSKTIKVNGVSKGITMVSFEHRITKVKEFFNKVSKELDTKVFLKAQNKPVKLGLKYE